MRLEPDVNEIIVTHVDPGETLSEIAARYGVSVDALQRWNRIEDPDLLQIGQRIVVIKAVDAPDSSTSEGAVQQRNRQRPKNAALSFIGIRGAEKRE